MGVVLSAVGMTTLLGARLQVHNLQQRTWAAPDRSVLAVIEGFGGHSSGDLAVDTVERELARATAGVDGVLAALTAASAHLHAAPPDAAPRLASVTVAVLSPTGATMLHVGSNAAYLLRGGTLRRLTADHTFDANEGRYHRRIIFQVLGAEREAVERTAVQLKAGDRLVIASGTVVRALTDDELVAGTATGDAAVAASALVELAHARIHDDSATAIVAAFI